MMRPLEERIGFLLGRAHKSYKRAFDAMLSEYGLTSPQWSVLWRLWEHDGLTQTELCRSLFTDGPTITGIIDRLERDGFVTRQRDSNDRRVIRVSLTDKGFNLEKILSKEVEVVRERATKGMTPKEVEQLKHLVNRVWQNMSESEN
ncbi:MAG: MarR family transcriptional regulator [Candidatus Tectomicrobia bacterium]|nr:MarR family transcriptional regulator [Candidatus Tectomicrobia bacterium]